MSSITLHMNCPDVCKRNTNFQKQEITLTAWVKIKGVLRQAEVALGVLGRLRPRIMSIFGTTRVVGCQPYAPAAFTPGEIPGTLFQRLSRPQGTWFCHKEPRKKSQVTPPGVDPGTLRLVAQRLNHYATPGPYLAITYLHLRLSVRYKLCLFSQKWPFGHGNLCVCVCVCECHGTPSAASVVVGGKISDVQYRTVSVITGHLFCR